LVEDETVASKSSVPVAEESKEPVIYTVFVVFATNVPFPIEKFVVNGIKSVLTSVL